MRSSKRASFTSAAILFLLSLMMFDSRIALAETITLTPTDDGYMYETGPGGDGSNTRLKIGYSTTYGNYRSKLKFNLSQIPAGSTINSAYLKVHYTGYVNSYDERNIRVYRVTSNWSESSITWDNNYYAYYDQHNVGGQYKAWYSWNVRLLVEYWMNGTYSNYGMMLKCYPEGGSITNVLTFESKEDGSYTPYLEINYTPPQTGDIYEPDNSYSQAKMLPHNACTLAHSIDPANDQDWAYFDLSSTSDVIIDTYGPSGDTRMWLYDSSLNQIEYDDDDGTDNFSKIIRSGSNALPPGRYYVKIDEYGNNNIIPEYYIDLTVEMPNNPPNSPTFQSVPSDGVYPTRSYSVTVNYTDPNGGADLQYVYLRLAQNNDEGSYRQTLMWGLSGSPAQWSDETHYLYDLSASITSITNGYRVTWNFKVNWNWHESDDVDLWAWALDDQNQESYHTKYNAGWDYENDIRIYGSSENKDPVTAGETYTVTGNVVFEGTTLAPSNWSGISVEMRRGSVSGTLLNTDTSVSGGYSVNWGTSSGDIGTHDIYIVPKNTNHQPPNNSDTYWDKVTVTVNPDWITTRFAGNDFINKTAKIGIPILLKARLQSYEWLLWWDRPGETVHFEIYYSGGWQPIPDDGIASTSVVTDANGYASVYYTPPKSLAPGNYSIRAKFDGTNTYAPCTLTRTLTIKKPKWLVMIYLCADNDLEIFSVEDFYTEMWAARNNDEVSICVLYDRAVGFSSQQPFGGADWTNTRYYRFCNDVVIHNDWDELNLGSQNVLQSFVDKATSQCSADYTSLILWNHGSGWKIEDQFKQETIPSDYIEIEQTAPLPPGIQDYKLEKTDSQDDGFKAVCTDLTGDNLLLSEIRNVLNSLTNGGINKIDILGYDACVMGMIEVAYDSANYARYLVASEDNENGDGWEYDSILNTSAISGTTTPLLWGQRIVDESIQTTLGCWDLSRVGSRFDEITAMSNRLNELIYDSSTRNMVITARNNSRRFSSHLNGPLCYVDLRQFVTEIANITGDSVLSTSAQALAAGLIDTSFRIRWRSTLPDANTLGGLSIYFPDDTSDSGYANYFQDNYLLFTSNADQHWDDFLRMYFDDVMPSCSITAPNSGGWFRGDIIVTATASDSTSDILYVEFQYSLNNSNYYQLPGPDSPDGKDWYAPNGWALTFRTTNTPQHGNINDASVWVRARAMDKAGNLSTWDYCNISFGVDNMPPDLSGSSGHTANPQPGAYSMLQSIIDLHSGVLDNNIYPRFYYRWNNSTVDSNNYSGVIVGSWNGSFYEAIITISETNIGDRLYWRVLGSDNVGNLNWSPVHDGGVIGPGKTLSSIDVIGPSTVNESTNTQYNAIAYFSDGSNSYVTANCTWSENSQYAAISSIGVLTTYSVSSNQSVRITASYTYYGITKTDFKDVTILNIDDKTLDYIVIEGPNEVNENSTQDYNCRAYYTDGTDSLVEPNWIENSSYANISSTGLLTTFEVPSDQNCQISATYTFNGVAKSDTHQVTIKNVSSTDPTITSLSPSWGYVGTWVTISGANFNSPQGTVTFNGVNASINSWSETQIEAVVPPGATTGPVVVHTFNGDDSNGVTFTVTFVPPGNKADFNGDGNVDVLWRYYGNGGYNAVWLRGTATTAASVSGISPEKIKNNPGVVDMGDGKPIEETGEVAAKVDTGMSISIQELRKLGIKDGFEEYHIAKVDQSKPLIDPFDFYMKKSKPGEPVSRIMASTVSDPRDDPEAVELPAAVNLDWKLCGTGDFNGDDKVDLVWRNLIDGRNLVWYMDGVTLTGTEYLPSAVDLDWTLCGTGDFNSDGIVDLVWRNLSDGRNLVWYLDGVTLTGTEFLPTAVNMDWALCGSGDFNSDGKVDLVWRNLSDGRNLVWYLDGVTLTGTEFLPTAVNMDWTLCGTGDFNSDGNVDLVWRNLSDGGNLIWYLDGVTLTGTESLTTVTNTTWRIEN